MAPRPRITPLSEARGRLAGENAIQQMTMQLGAQENGRALMFEDLNGKRVLAAGLILPLA
ncbi:hypothetical protein CF70_015385 [Cupriavidus sp. SK-3]|nr:hypothetical protein CF70_015385 [Cupriavidus sp. SK-3]